MVNPEIIFISVAPLQASQLPNVTNRFEITHIISGL